MNHETYTEEQFASNYPVGMQNYYWTYARNKFLHRKIRHWGLSGRRIVEIGCATGLVVSYLRKQGVQVWGVELGNAPALPDVKEFLHTNTDYKDLPAELKASTEVVMLLDVIEHVENPAEFMAEVAAHFPNASHILMTVPARQELWSSYDIDYGHYRRYDFDRVREDFLKTGFSLSKVQYFFKLLYFPAWIAAKTSGKRNSQVRPPLTPFSIAVHRVLAFILYLDTLLMPGSWRGSSIIALLKRNCSGN